MCACGSAVRTSRRGVVWLTAREGQDTTSWLNHHFIPPPPPPPLALARTHILFMLHVTLFSLSMQIVSFVSLSACAWSNLLACLVGPPCCGQHAVTCTPDMCVYTYAQNNVLQRAQEVPSIPSRKMPCVFHYRRV